MENLVIREHAVIKQDQVKVNNELIAKALENMEVSEKTRETYKRGLTAFLKWVEQEQYNAIDLFTIKAFKKHCMEKYSPNTTNCYLTSLKALYGYLELNGLPNYCKQVKQAKTDKGTHSKDSLTREQVKQIIASCNGSDLESLRNKAIFITLVNTGLREMELANALISDIGNLDNKTVLYIKGKGRGLKNDYVILNSTTIKAINDYLLLRGASSKEPLFTSVSDRNKGKALTTRTIRNVVKGLYAANGIFSERLTTHSTRHTFITMSLKAGVSLQETQQRARHKNINTTLIYAHNLKITESNAESVLEAYLNN